MRLMRSESGHELFAFFVFLATVACDGDPPIRVPTGDGGVAVTPVWSTETLSGCTYVSPIVVESQGQRFLLGVGQRGG